jgi:hypothetical protein
MQRMLIIATAIALAACSARSDPVDVPSTWKRVDAGPFSFWAPADVRAAPPQGLPFDSYVGDYQGRGLVIMFDYGAYASALTAPGSDLRWHNELIGGREARMVSYATTPRGEFRYPNFVAVHLVEGGGHGMSLTMYASCAGLPTCRDAQAVFRSIRFK